MKFSRSMMALLITLLCCQASTLRADEDFEAKLYKSSNGNSIPYRIYMPGGMSANTKYPLVVFFHGAGERGMDNTRQLIHGVRNILAYSKESNDPAIIIAAQVPNNEQWVNTPWGADSHVMPEAPSLPMKLTMDLMQDIMLDQSVDKERIYVTGISMGGFGTWDILQRMPDRIAAAIPVCGGGDVNQAKRIKGTSINLVSRELILEEI